MKSIIESFAHYFKLPSYCLLCKQNNPSRLNLCPECIDCLQPLTNGCACCARPLNDGAGGLCGVCIKSQPSFNQVWCSYIYQEPLRSMIHDFKFKQQLHLVKTLGHLMMASAPSHLDNACIIPVPLHPNRLRNRGYNQASVLAKYLSRQCNIPVDYNLCKRVTNTLPQALLGIKERSSNTNNAFSARKSPYSTCIIVDDLITTGHTANELSKALKRQGVNCVFVWCIARAVSL